MAEITENPDYQLLMKYLKSITPNDMDQESSEQLMMIGQRIEAGGALSDREREMFEAVVGETDRFPVEQINTFPQGTNPNIMNDPQIRDSNMGAVSDSEMQMMNVPPKGDSNMGAVSDSEMQMMQDTLSRLGLPPMTDEERMTYQVDDRTEQMTPSQMAGERSRGAITPDAGRVMSLEDAIAAGLVNPTRPQARPMMTSPRPQMRR